MSDEIRAAVKRLQTKSVGDNYFWSYDGIGPQYIADLMLLAYSYSSTCRPDDDEPATAEWVEALMNLRTVDVPKLWMLGDTLMLSDGNYFEARICSNPTRRDVRELCRVLRIPMKEGV